MIKVHPFRMTDALGRENFQLVLEAPDGAKMVMKSGPSTHKWIEEHSKVKEPELPFQEPVNQSVNENKETTNNPATPPRNGRR